MMYVVIWKTSAGDLIHGPFKSAADADRWASKNYGNCAWRIAKVEEPSKVGN